MTLFWSNTIWYLLLAATSAVALTVTLLKASDRRHTLGFFFGVLGFTYWLEVLLLMVLGAYTYYPMITPSDPFQDAIIGNFFSQFSVASTAVLISVLDLSNAWILIFSALYFIVDKLFVHLGIYVHSWYNSFYTLVGFMVYSYLIRRWHRRLKESPGKVINFITLFLAVFSTAGNSIITFLNLLKIRVFDGGFFSDPTKDHTAVALVYGPLLIVIMIALYRWKGRWPAKGLVFGVLLACGYLLYRYDFMLVRPGWFLAVALLDLLGYYLWVALMDRLLGSLDGKTPLPGRSGTRNV